MDTHLLGVLSYVQKFSFRFFLVIKHLSYFILLLNIKDISLVGKLFLPKFEKEEVLVFLAVRKAILV